LPNTFEYARKALIGRLLNLEGGQKLYHWFATKRANEPPAYINRDEHFISTAWASIGNPRSSDGLGHVERVFGSVGVWSVGNWQPEPFDCSRPGDAIMVGTLREIDDHGRAIEPCSRCKPENLLLPQNSAERLQAYSTKLGWFMDVDYLSPFYPYVVWRCTSGVGGIQDETENSGN
jgi:hypothetical protein